MALQVASRGVDDEQGADATVTYTLGSSSSK
jgi:hypothetical protein